MNRVLVITVLERFGLGFPGVAISSLCCCRYNLAFSQNANIGSGHLKVSFGVTENVVKQGLKLAKVGPVQNEPCLMEQFGGEETALRSVYKLPSTELSKHCPDVHNNTAEVVGFDYYLPESGCRIQWGAALV